jgi:riboflavin synthase
VNVELAMQPTDRFGGHFVSGHVDGVGTIVGVSALPGETRMKVRVPPELASMMIMKGSVAVDGVSLTIAALEADAFEVSLIPHTMSVTTLERKRAGEPVNIECDMIGKWIRRFMRAEDGRGSSEGALTIKRLEEEGF